MINTKKMRRMTARICLLPVAALLFALPAQAAINQTKGTYQDKFRQLDEVLPTANSYRTAGGEPGHEYWQQRVDYDIDVRLLEARRRIEGSERVRYTNNSPDTLRFLWLQLDQNRFRSDSIAERSASFADPSRRGPSEEDAMDGKPPRLSLDALRRQHFLDDNALGYEIQSVRDSRGELDRTIVDTNMRIDLRTPLKPGDTAEFQINFAFNIVDENAVVARAGYEHFPDDERDGGNERISSSWASALRTDGWNSVSIQRSAAASSAQACPCTAMSATAATTSSCWRSGSRACTPTPITKAGPTNPFLAVANSRWNLATTPWTSPCPRTTSSRPPAS